MPEKYFAYLLRIWRTGPQENPNLRFMLEDPFTREVFGFDSFDAFIHHLQNLMVEKPIDPNEVD